MKKCIKLKNSYKIIIFAKESKYHLISFIFPLFKLSENKREAEEPAPVMISTPEEYDYWDGVHKMWALAYQNH